MPTNPDNMHILQVHNKYQMQGGEDQVVKNERDLLITSGETVSCYEVSNSDIAGKYSKLKVALNVHYSKSSKFFFATQLENLKPDVVHVHNFFPLLTPSLYDACQDAGIPVVQTLHNYRTICPGALLLRDGKICEKCVTASPYNAVVHKCYRDSAVGSLFVARMVAYHRKHKTWQTKVSQFIALTEFAKNKFVKAGFPKNKISVKPNFVKQPVHDENDMAIKEDMALFVGRISHEKGIDVLLNSWESLDYSLVVAGEGTQLEKYKQQYANSAVQFLGLQSNMKIERLMRRAQFLVVPSIWYEGFPMVIVEAFALGLPVVCSNLGGMAEVVEDGVTGMHFKVGDSEDLKNKIKWLSNHPDECKKMGDNAWKIYIKRYSQQSSYKTLVEIYQRVVNEGTLEQ